MQHSLSYHWSGFAAAWSVVLIWAMWLIVSRVAGQSGLTIYDLAAFRYGLASFIALPIVIYYKAWRGLTFGKVAIISTVLGPLYVLAVFEGFRFAPAAHGGIFMNGVLPIISIFITYLFFKTRPKRHQLIGAMVILLSVIGLATDQGLVALDLRQSWKGDLLFLVGAAFFGLFMSLSRRWNLRLTQVIFCGTLVNCALFVPVWYVFLPSGISAAPLWPLIIQMVYQGFVPSLIGILLVAHASNTLGPEQASAILAAVPGVGALFGVLFLHEVLGIQSWISLVFLTMGLLYTTLGKVSR